MCISTPKMPDFPEPTPPPPTPPIAPAPIIPDSPAPSPTPILKDAESGIVKGKNSKRSALQQQSQGSGSLAIPLAGASGGAPKKDGPGLSIPT
jgi:hypothetical protein